MVRRGEVGVSSIEVRYVRGVGEWAGDDLGRSCASGCKRVPVAESDGLGEGHGGAYIPDEALVDFKRAFQVATGFRVVL